MREDANEVVGRGPETGVVAKGRSTSAPGEAVALDLFAGLGWAEAMRAMGRAELGVELDEDVCATRQARGHETIRGDVAALDPTEVAPNGCDLLIASPPCQAWSSAGKKSGQREIVRVHAATDALAAGRELPDEGEWLDPRSELVIEPLRWALALRPRLIALEQVPPVLEYWRHIGEILRGLGYSVWAGILSAERYGVPQTRRRAILMADRTGPVQPPAPTHQAYVPGEPARHEITLEGEILPWVSMAEALGWPGGEREYLNGTHDHRAERPDTDPAPTLHFGERLNTVRWRVGFPRQADDGAATEDGYRERDFRDTSAPAFAVTEKARSWTVNTGRDWKPGGEREDAQAFDAAERPAPAVDSKGRWHVIDTGCTSGGRNPGGARVRDGDEPAPPITSRGDQLERRAGPEWTRERPATTVQADDRIARPGHKGQPGKDPAPGQMIDAVRVAEDEAAVLQGFPRGYPWHGSRTAKFQQIGNAVPPPLAKAILEALYG